MKIFKLVTIMIFALSLFVSCNSAEETEKNIDSHEMLDYCVVKVRDSIKSQSEFDK